MKPLQAILAAFLCVCSPMLAYSQNAVEEVFNSNDSSSQQTFTSEVDFSPLPPAPPVEEPSLDLGYEIEGCSDAQCTDTFDECVTDCQSPVWVNFSPYLWATQTKGTVTVEGNTVPLNLDLSDLWDIMKNGEVRGGFMGHVEFGRDNWSMMINADIISMAPSEEFLGKTINSGLTLDVLEIGMTRTIFTKEETSDPYNSPLSVQLLGGVRYYSLAAEATISGQQLSLTIDQEDNWVDLFAGARMIAEIAPGVKGVVRGDWAGFGIGTSSQKTWNLSTMLVFECDFADLLVADLLVGYRILDIEQSKNGGTGAPRGFGVDNKIHGPMAGLSFQF